MTRPTLLTLHFYQVTKEGRLTVKVFILKIHCFDDINIWPYLISVSFASKKMSCHQESFVWRYGRGNGGVRNEEQSQVDLLELSLCTPQEGQRVRSVLGERP